MMPLRNLLIATLKLAISGAIVAAIAAIFLVISDDGTVPEAQADLTDLVPGGPDDHLRFERVLKRAGLQPRPFDHNGNIVKFAVGETNLSPLDLMEYFQREFQREGINSEHYTESILTNPATEAEATEYLTTQASAERSEAMLRGEIVPLFIDEDMVTMGSFIPKMKAQDMREAAEKWIPRADGSIHLDDNMGGFRTIEARRDPETGLSTVTATWSDRGFDAHKANGTARVVGASPDTEIPVCPGCIRYNRLKGLSREDPYVLNQIVSQGSVDTNHQFYTSALSRRGWVTSETEQALSMMSDHAPELSKIWSSGRIVSLKRDDQENMNLFLADDGDGATSIISIQELRKD